MKEIDVVAGIIRQNEKILIARRRKGKKLEGFWEFPGGKIENGENPKQALRRELFEELGVWVIVQEYIMTSHFDYPNFKINLFVYYCCTSDKITESVDHDLIKWILPINHNLYRMAPADVPIFEKLIE